MGENLRLGRLGPAFGNHGHRLKTYFTERTAMSPEEQHYLIAHKASGLKAGDPVLIVRAAQNYEYGWQAYWAPEMNSTVAKIGTITKDRGEYGFAVDIEGRVWHYPYFILEKLEDPQTWLAKRKIKAKEKKGMINSLKTHYKKHEDVLFPLLVVVVLDHFFNDGRFRDRIVKMVDSLLDKVTSTLANKLPEGKDGK